MLAVTLISSVLDNASVEFLSLKDMQKQAMKKLIELRKNVGCINHDGVLYGPDVTPTIGGQLCLPSHYFPSIAKVMHGKDHISKRWDDELFGELLVYKGILYILPNVLVKNVLLA